MVRFVFILCHFFHTQIQDAQYFTYGRNTDQAKQEVRDVKANLDGQLMAFVRLIVGHLWYPEVSQLAKPTFQLFI